MASIFSLPRLTHGDNSFEPFPKKTNIKHIYAHHIVITKITGQKKTCAASFDRPYFPPTFILWPSLELLIFGGWPVDGL